MTTAVQEFVARQERINQRRRILHPMLRALGSLLVQVEVTGLEHVPPSGATLLMMNHISFIDPIVFTGVVPHRYVISMAKSETLDGWFSRGIVRLWGNFVVNRSTVDRAALHNAIELLKSEQLVLIAPEGTRNPQGLQAPKSGVVYIANKANAVIVPAAICGAQDWVKRLRSARRAYARVHFGRPFRFRLPPGERLTRPVREQMIREAMYQLALAMPDEYAEQRGLFRDVQHATTQYLEFL